MMINAISITIPHVITIITRTSDCNRLQGYMHYFMSVYPRSGRQMNLERFQFTKIHDQNCKRDDAVHRC
jgi:hypothetical protein